MRENVYMNLRNKIFELSPTRIGVAVEPGGQEPWGILMEMGYPQAVVTLVSLATGDASLYFSSGGGVLGGIGHENIRNAARRFVRSARDYTDKMAAVAFYPLPDLGRVRFYVLTPQAVLTAEAGEEDLGESRSDLSPLFYAGQDVMTEMRLVSR
jgi:hypothetical protein